MTALALALGLLGSILGVASLTLALYNLIITKARVVTQSPLPDSPFREREVARAFLRGEPEGPPAVRDNLGMPEVYDPELDDELDELGI